MPKLAVVTPSYSPDIRLFADLHASVLEHTTDDTVHHVFVPPADLAAFARFEGPRCRVIARSDALPGRYLRMPRSEIYVNARRPWPPVRGWITQQAIKIHAAATIDADVALIADSDVVLVRPTRAERFIRDGRPLLYREENAVNESMTRHVIWHHVARRLLGLPPPPPLPLPDYVGPLIPWRPSVVEAMRQRVSEVTGRHWLDAFTAEVHISEFILYGVFVDEVLGEERPESDTTFCHTSYDHTAWDERAAVAFADRLGPDAVGMAISAKSNTPHHVRQAAVRRCAEVAAES
ncbi:DUF6492 family protein [Spongiactinospora sp. TRM90649]|uniref:DUF6492 family protein n=1 Tax=Spongiactinospora sp. TRM90649 TaxID=3031114 RepID=UPI0023F7D748|nr:DUF6492 family protein [Spongiactinospora sp. TRM90649]MDF5755014.1 DUF6492 family protein [Spongiactinospora sp. TRM90649]